MLIPAALAFALMFGSFGVMGAAVGSGPGSTAGLATFFITFGIVWLLLVSLGIAGLVFSIIGMIRASRWQDYRYPINIRFVKR
jgi:uncharacterized Tic20 family protein